MNRRRMGILLGALALLAAPGGPARADEMLYVVEGDRLVFTNTPSARDARPVPGFQDPPAPRAGGLPATIYDPFIQRVADELGIAPSLIKAVALVESGLNPHAVSPKGAQGLMQLMPDTARRYGVDDAFDPLQNLRAGAAHLRHLLDEFDGDETLALAAYNAGSGAVRRHGGVPDYRETRDYVRRVRGHLGRRPSRAGAPEAERPEVRLDRRPDGTLVMRN